jgi:transcriptional activator SPT7
MQNLLPPDLFSSLGLPTPPPYEPVWKEENLPPVYMNSQSSFELMKRTSVLILAHSGFDSTLINAVTSEQALDCFAEIACNYFMGLIQTLRLYMDRFGTTMSVRDILLHVLSENGIQDIDNMDGYIKQDVFRHGKKLQDLRKRLEAAYNELENGDAEMQDDIQIESHYDQIITGNLFDDLGVDFLNLKDAGLDFKNVLYLTRFPFRSGTRRPKSLSMQGYAVACCLMMRLLIRVYCPLT